MFEHWAWIVGFLLFFTDAVINVKDDNDNGNVNVNVKGND